ncbi:hypothetical protein [Nocardia sp. NPDC051570]|uniref:hypothetical protein n=1 Tax=Nocardia sp. NPDC051570 TaxID=3364324 RepID=UPI0037A6B646
MTTDLHVDPEAVAAYVRTSRTVQDQLTAAAVAIRTAADVDQIDRLAADLGSVGATLTSAVVTILEGHADVLAAAAARVGRYGEGISTLQTTVAETDAAHATEIGSTGPQVLAI